MCNNMNFFLIRENFPHLNDNILIEIFSYISKPYRAWILKNRSNSLIRCRYYNYSGINGKIVTCYAVSSLNLSYDTSKFKCIGIVFNYIESFDHYTFPTFNYVEQNDKSKNQINLYNINLQWQHRQLLNKFIYLFYSLINYIRFYIK